MADPFPIRAVTSDEFTSFRRVHDHAFNDLPGALVRLSAAMTWDPAPWCPQLF